MIKPCSKVAILDEDDGLFRLLSENNNTEMEFILFKDIKMAEDYVKKSKVICILTETIIKKQSAIGVVQVIRNNQEDPNFKTPIIIYSSQINSGFISRVKDKVLAAFKKPIDSDESFQKFIPLIVHIFKRKKTLEKHIEGLEQSHGILHKNIEHMTKDKNLAENQEKNLLLEFLEDLRKKQEFFDKDVSPHFEDAFQDNFNKEELEKTLKNIDLNETNDSFRTETCENLSLYKAAQSEIQKINKSFSEAFLGDPAVEKAAPELSYKTELDHDYREQVFKAIEAEDSGLLRGLVKIKARFDVSDYSGNTPLHTIVEKGNLELLNILLEVEMPLDTINKKGQTALSIAIENQNRDIVSELLSKDCSLNERDGRGMTPLMIASNTGVLDLAIDLVSAGADLSLKNHDGFSAIELAKRKGHKKIVKFLKSFESGKITA